MQHLTSTVCGFQHESIWDRSSVTSGDESISLRSFITDFTQKIVECPFSNNGFNVICAHPSTINKNSNYLVYFFQTIEDMSVDSSKKE